MKLFAATTLVAGMIVFTLWGCASTGVGESPSKTEGGASFRATIEPSRLYEHCMELDKGQTMAYTFASKESLNFYIHYHNEGIKYEKDRSDGVSSLEGSFSPDAKQLYCLTWTNPQTRSVNITYSFEVGQR